MGLVRRGGVEGVWDLGDKEWGKGGDKDSFKNEGYRGNRSIDVNGIFLFFGLGYFLFCVGEWI